jgi:hypothetical protein
MSIRALKTMPLMMAVMDGASADNANRQWEIHVAAIKALQHLEESIVQRYLGIQLQAKGIQADVKFRFAELRSAELLRDAQTETLWIANESAKYAMGYTTLDEGALRVTGHKADEKEPRVMPGSVTQEPKTNPEDIEEEVEKEPTNPSGSDRMIGRIIDRWPFRRTI